MGKSSIRQILRYTVVDDLKGMMNALKGGLYMLRHYKWRLGRVSSMSPMLIFNVTEDFYSGGMADRFKGAVTAYAYCKQRGIDFRIRYIYPFELSDYLLPASYDWRLKEGEYVQCIPDSRLLYARAEHGRRLLRLKPSSRQIHFYGNYNNLDILNSTGNTDYKWGELFKELFRPGQELEKIISEKKSDIGSEYISAVFRFQNLLGDFKEYGFHSIEEQNKRDELVSLCLAGLEELHGKYPGMPLLVTSDSSTFIQKVSSLPYVHTIGGKRVHIGSGSGEDVDTYMGSFVDFYMLAGSRMIFSLGSCEMYPTQFPMYAAKLNDVPFVRIRL